MFRVQMVKLGKNLIKLDKNDSWTTMAEIIMVRHYVCTIQKYKRINEFLKTFAIVILTPKLIRATFIEDRFWFLKP